MDYSLSLYIMLSDRRWWGEHAGCVWHVLLVMWTGWQCRPKTKKKKAVVAMNDIVFLYRTSVLAVCLFSVCLSVCLHFCVQNRSAMVLESYHRISWQTEPMSTALG